MSNKQKSKRKYGNMTMLTLNVQYACSIMTFLFALFCYFKLDIRGIVFQALLGYSILNTINVLLFFKHQVLEVFYNIASGLAFLVIYIVCLYSGGVNSLFTTFMVLLVFFGYISGKKYGYFWLATVTLAMVSLYIIGKSNFKIESDITILNKDDFSFFIIIFFIALFGGVFGMLISNNYDRIRKAKKEIANKNEEKAIMLKEIHHRVKNNLHVVNSLLRIQSRSVKDQDVKSMFSMAQSRIVAMARLHEKIYKTDNLKFINVKEHIQELIDDLIKGYNVDKEIIINLDIAPIEISIDTLLPLSLIINELVSNSLKHAFNGMEKGELVIQLNDISPSQFELIIGDNGKGTETDILSPPSNSTGVILIKTFVKQLNGSIDLLPSNEGMLYKIEFSEIQS